jgi:hypothetical protein
VGRTNAECLNYFIVFGDAHLRNILQQRIGCYHKCRPHLGLGNVPLDADLPPPESLDDFRLENVAKPQAGVTFGLTNCTQPTRREPRAYYRLRQKRVVSDPAECGMQAILAMFVHGLVPRATTLL